MVSKDPIFILHLAKNQRNIHGNVYICRAKDENALEIDFGAIDFTTPRLSLPSSIGNGADYISKFISAKLGGSQSSRLEPLLNYLLHLNHHGEVIFLFPCSSIFFKVI